MERYRNLPETLEGNIKEGLLSEEQMFMQDSDNSPNVSGRHKEVDIEKNFTKRKKKAEGKAAYICLNKVVRELLAQNDNARYYTVCDALIKKAEGGDTRAFEIIRDLIDIKDEPETKTAPLNINININGDDSGVRGEE